MRNLKVSWKFTFQEKVKYDLKIEKKVEWPRTYMKSLLVYNYNEESAAS